MRAVALRRIEGEAVRLRFLQGKAALRVYQMLGIMGQGTAFAVQNGQGAFADIERPPHGIPDAAVVSRFRLQAVHHHFNEVGFVTVQGVHLLQFTDFPVYADLRVAALAQLVEQLPVMALAAAHQRRKQVALAALILAHDQVYNLLVRVAHHLLAAFGGEGAGTLGIQQAQEVIDFRNGPHRGTGVVAGGFLLYGNDGAEAGDFFHLRLLQDAHEMLGIGGEGVHVAALALGINRIKRQRTLAAAAEACHHHEFPAGNIHAYVLQVVGPRTPYLDKFPLFHRLQRYEKSRLVHQKGQFRVREMQNEGLVHQKGRFRVRKEEKRGRQRDYLFFWINWPMPQHRAATAMPLMEAKPQCTRLATMAPATTPTMALQSTTFSWKSFPLLNK